MILIISKPAASAELFTMQEEFGTLIKLAVDVEQEMLAGGGALHFDCEQILLDNGSSQWDIWGADWLPLEKEVGFESLINIRPRQQNFGLELQNPELRAKVEKIVRNLLEIE